MRSPPGEYAGHDARARICPPTFPVTSALLIVWSTISSPPRKTSYAIFPLSAAGLGAGGGGGAVVVAGLGRTVVAVLVTATVVVTGAPGVPTVGSGGIVGAAPAGPVAVGGTVGEPPSV